MNEQLVKETLQTARETAEATAEAIKNMLPPEDPKNDETKVSENVKNALDWQQNQREKREQEVKKNGYYTGKY